MQAAGLADAVGAIARRDLALDRPGCGGSIVYRYLFPDYPQVIARFADTLGIADLGVIGVSGGGRYACPCAAGAARRRDTWSRQDRQLYTLADKAPRLLRLALAGLARGIHREPDRALGCSTTCRPSMSGCSNVLLSVRCSKRCYASTSGREPADRPMTSPSKRGRGTSTSGPSSRRWTSGTARRTTVSVQQAEILVRALPDHANSHILTREGRALMVDHMREVLEAFT
jgi:pimeloyl-ACP methyl ester carboxylesterase